MLKNIPSFGFQAGRSIDSGITIQTGHLSKIMSSILVIDDSWFQRASLRTILEDAGYQILEAENGRIGLLMAVKHEPDCVLLDVLMPEMDGITTLRKMREQALNMPIIMVTADIQETTKQECLSLGAQQVIHKPIDPDSDLLPNLVQQALKA